MPKFCVAFTNYFNIESESESEAIEKATEKLIEREALGSPCYDEVYAERWPTFDDVVACSVNEAKRIAAEERARADDYAEF